MENKEISVTCKGSSTVPLDKLQDFQGNLKTLGDAEFEKLKRQILKYGFSFPVFVWGDHILDGHQRVFVVRSMVDEGYTITDIPVVEIEAKDKKEAGEKLLALNSHYAKMTDEGLNEFLHDMSIDVGAIAGDLELPDIDMDSFLEGWVNDIAPSPMDSIEDAQQATDDVVVKISFNSEVWIDANAEVGGFLERIKKKYKAVVKIDE